ncbi:MAG: isocitrate/isopropylmalate family dehydrogenase, partial [Acidobacteriota bacterium]|nr:isocitrate/isopropylmalate family dehydrogenase [Acidobacteriota bacterium]
MSLTIALLPGDGIGPEVTAEAVRILKNVAQHAGKSFTFSTHRIGGVAIDSDGQGLPEATLEACLGADAVLLGAVGHPKFDGRLPSQRPEAALLALRQALGGYANLRPAICYAPLAKRTPFQPEKVKGADILIIRELLGGLYFGEPRGFEASGNTAFNTLIYSRHEVERVARVAFERARERRGRVASIDKANVLETSQLWRKVVSETAKEYPDIALEHVFVDTAAMRLATSPTSFDVMLCDNLFGDILSDQAAS